MAPPLVDLVMAARPNFMKVAPLYHELVARGRVTPRLVHTGQHYDPLLSESILTDLGIDKPHLHLGIGSGTHAEQTGRTLIAYEAAIRDARPALTVVVGDVNATAACALAAAKLHVPVAHLEAGLRSGDRTMPEELNRIVADALSDVLWTPSPDGDANLQREGIPSERITRVGNIMIDAFVRLRDVIEAVPPAPGTDEPYGVVTMHRPQNVDTPDTLRRLLDTLRTVAQSLPLVFPLHPRTQRSLDAHGLLAAAQATPGLRLIPPLSYIPFMALVRRAALVITDSGGVQEETTYLGIPCITVRPNTERPITVTLGTNRLARPDEVAALAQRALNGDWPRGTVPPLWDGQTAARVADDLEWRLGLA